MAGSNADTNLIVKTAIARSNALYAECILEMKAYFARVMHGVPKSDLRAVAEMKACVARAAALRAEAVENVATSLSRVPDAQAFPEKESSTAQGMAQGAQAVAAGENAALPVPFSGAKATAETEACVTPADDLRAESARDASVLSSLSEEEQEAFVEACSAVGLQPWFVHPILADLMGGFPEFSN